ncbi:hypothetical protein BWZ22_07635 [Seonamhaeicola sp. S2-3]|uniref:DUF6994 family protein n=1 Tax=Seonamhaeicola sp. S2-3 TaxID=1936081 RepID=UPI000972953D|nr:hypothetical protein [Seonamhaeicola sp. S2-3]APY11121.1 hypothetical protein BWZ22_07635 [Seonamhaeicola sp. S2-3]
MNKIDINFDFRKESKGRDPDRWSPTLQEYHRIVWSKPLPNGKLFTLSKTSQNRLYHKSELGEFYLSSDMALYGFVRKCHRTKFIVSQISETEIKEFEKLTLNTLGGTMIWPSIRIDNKITINGARGFNRLIADRLDLTIECVKRYYLGLDSPLYQVFKRYSSFFSLFNNFREYIDFFLLQDFIDEKEQVKFSLPFDDFKSPSFLKTIEEYYQFKSHITDLVNHRNKRILESIKMSSTNIGYT